MQTESGEDSIQFYSQDANSLQRKINLFKILVFYATQVKRCLSSLKEKPLK